MPGSAISFQDPWIDILKVRSTLLSPQTCVETVEIGRN